MIDLYFQPYGDEQQLNLNWIISEIINLHKQLDPDYETPSFTQVYPYSNLNRLNLDWVLSELKALKELAPEPSPELDIQAVAEALVALPFDSNTSYQIYDFISKDGEIWRATEAIPAGGAWDETKWFKTKLGTDLAVLERWINAINASLTTLENTVDELSSADLSDDSDAGGATVKASLNLLKGSLNSIQQHKRKVLFIGDSYGAQSNSWITFAAQYMRLTSAEYVNGSVSGIGFVVDRNGNIGADYNGFADAVAAITADRDSYTDVVICGGINDAQYDRLQSFLLQHIKNTIAYIKQNFINANVRIGFIGGALDNSPVLSGRTYERQQIAKYAYIAIGSPYYLNGVENAIHQSVYSYSDDKLHPNATGAELIGQAVATAIITGYATVIRPVENLTLIPPSNGAIQKQSNNIYYKNDTAIITFNNVFSATLTDGNYDVTNGIQFTFNDVYVNKKQTISGVTYMHNGTTGSLYNFRAELYQNTLTIFPLQIANNAWQSVPVRTLGLSQPLVFNIPSTQIN